MTDNVLEQAVKGWARTAPARTTELSSDKAGFGHFWQRSGELLIMVIFGGIGRLNGAIIGAAAFLLTEEFLSGFTEHWKVIFGPLLVVVALFARGGLIGVAQRLRGIVRG